MERALSQAEKAQKSSNNSQFSHTVGYSCTLGRAVQHTAKISSAVYYNQRKTEPCDRTKRENPGNRKSSLKAGGNILYEGCTVKRDIEGT